MAVGPVTTVAVAVAIVADSGPTTCFRTKSRIAREPGWQKLFQEIFAHLNSNQELFYFPFAWAMRRFILRA